MSIRKNNIEYKINKDLPIIKKNWKGNIVINGKFHNGIITEKPPLLDVLKWKFSKNSQSAEKKTDSYKLSFQKLSLFSKSKNMITWLGHASFIININNTSIITDPCFFDLPVSKRKVPLPCNIDNLKEIDYLLISHDHRDHFDKKSVHTIVKNNPKAEALIPLNANKLFRNKKLAKIKTQEAGWYQEYKISNNIRIIFLPARHWGRRAIFDFNKTLWGSFLIITDNKKIFFSGDTAYDDNMFKEIHNQFGDIDICILPIGAYAPQSIMKASHATPEEAYKIFNYLGGKTFIPMHYGTYDLSDEPLSEPIRRLIKCFKNDKRLKQLAVGEKFVLN